jgi:hypothetical protein
MAVISDNINEFQLDLLKGFKFIQEKKQLDEIKELLNFYLEKKLEIAISNKEKEANYTAAIYEKWLASNI